MGGIMFTKNKLKNILLATIIVQVILGIIVTVYSFVKGGYLFGGVAILVSLVSCYILYDLIFNHKYSENFKFTIGDAIGFPLLTLIFLYRLFQNINSESRIAISLMLAFSLIGCLQSILKYFYTNRNKKIEPINSQQNGDAANDNDKYNEKIQ